MPAITIHEQTADDGTLIRTMLSSEDGRLALASGGESLALPAGALEAVMRRFGKPVALEVAPLLSAKTPETRELAIEERLALGDGRELVRFRFLHKYDVVARDYLALLVEGEEPVCELSTAVTAALDHLARRLRAVAAG